MPVPLNLELNKYESNTDIFVFDEKQDLTLTSDVYVDITKAGTYNDAGDLTPGTIPAGTLVNSYLIHVDPVGTASSLFKYDGSITFSNKILGVIVNNIDDVLPYHYGYSYYGYSSDERRPGDEKRRRSRHQEELQQTDPRQVKAVASGRTAGTGG